MKVLGKEIKSNVLGWVALVGYGMGYSLYFANPNNYMYAWPFYVGMIAAFAWLYARKDERSFGYWVVVAWQVFVMFYFIQGLLGL
jgi:hypothetical protein